MRLFSPRRLPLPASFLAGFLVAALSSPAQAQTTQYSDHGQHHFRVGVEGFKERYEEPEPRVDEHAEWVSATADYKHTKNGYMTAVQLRGSYAQTDYKSPDGTIEDIPQIEAEARVITGLTIPIGNVGGVKAVIPYIGLGGRYFYDKSKGEVTTLGFFGYDRRIMQFYLPIGAMWSFEKWGFTFSQVAEFDVMFYGHVQSRFHNFDPGAENLNNKQEKGYGGRGEIMIGQQYEDFGWQAGPFVRYWKVEDSELDTVGGTQAGTYLEPENIRMQTGAALRINF